MSKKCLLNTWMNEWMNENGLEYLWNFLLNDISDVWSTCMCRTDFLPPYGDFIAFQSELHSKELPEGLGAERLARAPAGTGSWARAIAVGAANPGGRLCLQWQRGHPGCRLMWSGPARARLVSLSGWPRCGCVGICSSPTQPRMPSLAWGQTGEKISPLLLGDWTV